MSLFCALIDDKSEKRVCTSDVSVKRSFERLGVRVVDEPFAPCRPGHSSDCPSDQTCEPRFAHTSIPNALPTHCQPKES